MLIAAAVTSVLGSAILALSQPRHWQAVTGTMSAPRRSTGRIGWCLIAASLMLVILRDGFSFGTLFWPLVVGFGSLLTGIALTWMPTLMKPLARLFGQYH
ncbi:MAG: DUF3325 domain-containing protein [Porphyrobacter sp.]|nr:DUF3325 domain-containing protein [Porphyrobacter sp.]